jgi:DNA polymerase kappa
MTEAAHLFHFTANKAGPTTFTATPHLTATGMADCNRERVNKIVYEMSKDSKYFANEARKAAANAERIDDVQKRLGLLDAQQLHAAEAKADRIVESLRKSRETSRTWIHIDMVSPPPPHAAPFITPLKDMFFAAVEIRDRPELRDKPVAIGGMSMISTTNYVARKFGVRSAMPGFIGVQLCPDLVFVRHNMDKYVRESGRVKEILKEYDPEV